MAQPLLLASLVARLGFCVPARQRRWETRQTCHPSKLLNALQSERAASILAKTLLFSFSRKLYNRWLNLRGTTGSVLQPRVCVCGLCVCVLNEPEFCVVPAQQISRSCCFLSRLKSSVSSTAATSLLRNLSIMVQLVPINCQQFELVSFPRL